MAANDNKVQKFSDQFQYTGEGPLDKKQTPVEDLSQLPSPLKAYDGQTVTVLSDHVGETSDWVFKDGKWEKKYQIVDCGELV